MSAYLRFGLKNEYILKVSDSVHEITCYKLPQHPRSVFPWHVDVYESSVHMIHLMMFLVTGYFN